MSHQIGKRHGRLYIEVIKAPKHLQRGMQISVWDHFYGVVERANE